MRQARDLTGQVFGELTVSNRIENHSSNDIRLPDDMREKVVAAANKFNEFWMEHAK